MDNFELVLLFVGNIYLKLQFHGFESGGGFDGPDPTALRDLHDRGGDRGRLPEQVAHVQRLQELLVLLCRGSLVFPLESLHGDDDGDVGEAVCLRQLQGAETLHLF